jgi:hypothetical protein
MNTSSKLGPHAHSNRGACAGVGLKVYYKGRYTAGIQLILFMSEERVEWVHVPENPSCFFAVLTRF